MANEAQTLVGIGVLLQDKASHPGKPYREWFEKQFHRPFTHDDAVVLREMGRALAGEG